MKTYTAPLADTLGYNRFSLMFLSHLLSYLFVFHKHTGKDTDIPKHKNLRSPDTRYYFLLASALGSICVVSTRIKSGLEEKYYLLFFWAVG